MHGIIFLELKKYVETKLGAEAWSQLLKEAGLEYRFYLATETYADQEALALVSTATRITGNPAAAILEDFGHFIVPDLLKVYGALIKPQWKTLDLLENTESMIHTAVRIGSPGATPPALACSRPSPDEVVVTYQSPRKMCALAKGIVTGVAEHYNERVLLNETSCMLNGDACCEISVRVAG